MANLFPNTGQMEAQTPTMPTGGLFGENQAAQQAANRLAIQRMQALQQAQLSPEQNGAFMASNAANMLGNAAGALAPQQPDPMQMKLAQVKQAVDAEGLTDPEQYLRMAASKLVEAGLYKEGLEAQKQADAIAKSGADTFLKKAQGKEALANSDESHAKAVEALSSAGKNQQATQEKRDLAPYELVIKQLAATMTDPASLQKLAEARKADNEADMVKGIAEARIGNLNALAQQAKTISEKEAKQNDYQLMGSLFDEKGAGTITPAREALLNAMIDIKSKPQTVVNSVMGGNKTADTFMNPGAAAKPSAALPGVPKPPAAGAKLPAGIPAGSVPIGTAGGKPVFQTPDGRRLIVK